MFDRFLNWVTDRFKITEDDTLKILALAVVGTVFLVLICTLIGAVVIYILMQSNPAITDGVNFLTLFFIGLILVTPVLLILKLLSVLLKLLKRT